MSFCLHVGFIVSLFLATLLGVAGSFAAINMEQEVNFQTVNNQYKISIHPYKCQQDHENLDINVKSLVHLFEPDELDEGGSYSDSASSCEHSGHGQHTIVNENHYRSTTTAAAVAELPDIVVCSGPSAKNHSDSNAKRYFQNKDNYKKGAMKGVGLERRAAMVKPQPLVHFAAHDTFCLQPASHEDFILEDHHELQEDPNYPSQMTVVDDCRRRCYSDSVNAEDLDYCMDSADASLIEALKDMLDNTSHYKKRQHGNEKKLKRVKLKSKNTTQIKPFQDQVEEIFSPNLRTRCKQYLGNVVKSQWPEVKSRQTHHYENVDIKFPNRDNATVNFQPESTVPTPGVRNENLGCTSMHGKGDVVNIVVVESPLNGWVIEDETKEPAKKTEKKNPTKARKPVSLPLIIWHLGGNIESYSWKILISMFKWVHTTFHGLPFGVRKPTLSLGWVWC